MSRSRAWSIGGFAFGSGAPLRPVHAVVRSLSGSPRERTVSYQIDTATGEELIGRGPQPEAVTDHAAVAARRPGPRPRPERRPVARRRPTSSIQLYIAAGSYSLDVRDLSGDGHVRSDRAPLMPATDPFQPIPLGPASLAYAFPSHGIVAGDFNGDGHARPGRHQLRQLTPCRCCWATATGRSSPRSPTRSGAGPRRHRGGRLHRRRPPRPGRRQRQLSTTTVSVLLGNGDGTFQPQVTYAVGSEPDAIVAGDFNGDGHLDLAVANY